jgi:hypothetical protein
MIKPMSNQQTKLSPAQRASLFAQSTRQYKQELPSMSFKEGETVSISLPKTRFLSKISLKVKGSFKVTHASKTSYTKAKFDKYKLLRQIRLQINNGFTPYQMGGVELHLYNLMNNFNPMGADNFGLDVLQNVVSAGGTTDKVSYMLELPITLNDRDPVGLIMLQNEQTVTTLSVDCGYLKDIMTDTDITISDINIQITPVIETFSIPLIPDAIPDYSVIKLVNEQIENVVGAGDMIVKLPVGLTYRKILLYIGSDTGFTPIDHDKLGSFQLMFNQADTPYNVSADHVAYENRKAYGGQLPAGCYAFDFSSQGVANLGGGRDYIDTERLTEFWLKINFKEISGSSNYVYVVSEKLARLV